MANRKITTAFAYMFAVVVMLVMALSISSINASAVSLNLSLDATILNKGTAIKATATGSGGSDYQYSFAVKTPSSNNYTTMQNYSSSNVYTYTPHETGTFYIKATMSSTGNSPTEVVLNFTVVDLVNNSSISSNSTTVGSAISVNAKATGGSGNYDYKYLVMHPDNATSRYYIIGGNDNPFQTTSSVSFTPDKVGTYRIFVVVRDKSTGTTKESEFSLNANEKTYSTVLSNTSTINKTEFLRNETLVVQGSATGESGKYEYKFQLADLDGNVTGTAQDFGTKSTYQLTLSSTVGSYMVIATVRDKETKHTAVKKLTFAIKDKEYPELTVTANLNTSTINTPNDVIGNDKLTITANATGGAGGYKYRFNYSDDGGATQNLFNTSVAVSTNPSDIGDFGDGRNERSNFECQFKKAGKYKIYIFAYDSRNITVRKVYDITVKKAPLHSKNELQRLITSVDEWYDGLSPSQREIFRALTEANSNKKFNYHYWETALNNAKKVINSGSIYEVDDVYNELQKQHDLALKQTILASEASSVLFQVSNSMSYFLNWLLKGIGGLLTHDFGTQSPSSDFQGFDIQSFVDDYSPIFLIFANALLILLFGVNVFSTAVQYELFTLKGAVRTLAHFFFSKIWIDLSCYICILAIGVAREMLTSVISKANDILENINFSFAFNYNSGIPVVGAVVDFLVMALIMIIIFLLFIPLLVFLIRVIIKLFVMNFELAAMTAMSPVFFACLVGEETKKFFQNFFTVFLSILIELVFMGIVYAAFVSWYNSFGDMSSNMDFSNFDFGTQISNLAIFGVVFMAACHLMIKPPEIFKNLVR